ncbi:MAG TPA: hypothetical protein VIQ97_03990 [Prevotella sp.]
MNTRYILAILILTFIYGCGRQTGQKLTTIDSLLYQNNINSAYEQLQNVPLPPSENKEDMAYYTLLKTETYYKKELPVNSDSINYSIFYYEQNGPKDKLARAYYYKGITLYDDRKDVKNAIILLKKAENTAAEVNDLALQHKICQSICYVNLMSKNYSVGLLYSRKARSLAQKAQNLAGLAYSYTYTANAYYGLSEPDSNLHYLLKSLKYVKYLSRDNQAVLFTNLSDSYKRKNDTLKAKAFIDKALQIYPNSYTYAFFADFYIQRGEYAKAHNLLIKAANTHDLYTQENTLYNLFKLKRTMGDYEGAAQVADTLLAFKDTLEKIRQQENINEIQSRYDKENKEKQLKSYQYYAGGFLLILLLFITMLFLYHKYRVATNRKELIQKRLLLNEYSEQLSKMKLSHTATTKEVISLKQRINNMKDREVQVLSNGKILYDCIQDNDNIIHWSNQDLMDFLEYLKFIHPEFINQIDAAYQNLSPKQYFYLALTEAMNKTEKQAEQILAVSPSTIRSIKSRIKSKKNTIHP